MVLERNLNMYKILHIKFLLAEFTIDIEFPSWFIKNHQLGFFSD